MCAQFLEKLVSRKKPKYDLETFSGLRRLKHLGVRREAQLTDLGADHLTLEGGGVDDFLKKFPASPRRKKKIACSTNEIEKKFLHCCKQEKKMLQSYFIIPGGLYKIPAKLQPFFPCSLYTLELVMLQNVQCILSFIGSDNL